MDRLYNVASGLANSETGGILVAQTLFGVVVNLTVMLVRMY